MCIYVDEDYVFGFDIAVQDLVPMHQADRI